MSPGRQAAARSAAEEARKVAYDGLDAAITVAGSVVRRVRKRTIQYHFDAESYAAEVATNVPQYREMQAALAQATAGVEVGSVLELGMGTGETSAALLAVHPDAKITGLDGSPEMLEVARRRLPAANLAELVVGKLQDPLPPGSFDLVISSLAIHHLWAGQKRTLFERVHEALAPGRRFVMADVVRPLTPADAKTPVSRIYDRPARADQLERWMSEAGFAVARDWSWHDLVVLRGERAAAPLAT